MAFCNTEGWYLEEKIKSHLVKNRGTWGARGGSSQVCPTSGDADQSWAFLRGQPAGKCWGVVGWALHGQSFLKATVPAGGLNVSPKPVVSVGAGFPGLLPRFPRSSWFGPPWWCFLVWTMRSLARELGQFQPAVAWIPVEKRGGRISKTGVRGVCGWCTENGRSEVEECKRFSCEAEWSSK